MDKDISLVRSKGTIKRLSNVKYKQVRTFIHRGGPIHNDIVLKSIFYSSRSDKEPRADPGRRGSLVAVVVRPHVRCITTAIDGPEHVCVRAGAPPALSASIGYEFAASKLPRICLPHSCRDRRLRGGSLGWLVCRGSIFPLSGSLLWQRRHQLTVMDPVKKKYKQALKISEIADYLQDLEDWSEEDLNDIEVAILPPDEVDEVTDIEEGPDDDMGVIPVSDVAGQVEFSCTIDNVDEDHPTESTSRTSKTVSWRKETQIFAGTADGLGSRVVKKLLVVCMDPSAHEVYFDNFFSSVQLLIHLKSQGFRATGTVRDNRTKKCPIMTKQEMKKKHRELPERVAEREAEQRRRGRSGCGLSPRRAGLRAAAPAAGGAGAPGGPGAAAMPGDTSSPSGVLISICQKNISIHFGSVG
ncbi:PiggyBac transposable element-derived protein 1 [Eumeta japonica]|uniref:PiggyBac transposable element-derived protein 1 n=1 Tax=Eumeta variegata TaxID=151549 RepID=A0A4C1UXV3_EUMVA|nr:PiggyBac transposable element-derived protein 1 [Eumeta japonica]